LIVVIGVLKDGKIEQIETPEELKELKKTRF